MSPDNVFAAQMWGWPDAVLKRDANGAVLFVNAAFLSMYGGTVENWTGMAVTGWNAPPPAGQAVRFETRLPSAEGEIIYDWIEASGPDGTALAVARNVSDIMPDPGLRIEAETPPPVEAPPPTMSVDQSAFEAVMQTTNAAHADTPQTQAEEPTTESESQPAAVSDSESMTVDMDDLSLDPSDFDHVNPLDVAGPETPKTEPSAEASPQPTADLSEAEPPQEREFERRALPLEAENTVLGNNWRDAVIAKAVGAKGAETEVAPEADKAPELKAEPRQEGDPLRILLAEDNAINALLTRTLLEAEGCRVDTVEDGALAVEAMKVNTFDLIFMDMRMPNMDGLEATRKIRQMDHRSKGLPIVALTANAFDDDRNACFDAGMNDFMTKPVSAEELSEMVARWTSEDAREKLAS